MAAASALRQAEYDDAFAAGQYARQAAFLANFHMRVAAGLIRRDVLAFARDRIGRRDKMAYHWNEAMDLRAIYRAVIRENRDNRECFGVSVMRV